MKSLNKNNLFKGHFGLKEVILKQSYFIMEQKYDILSFDIMYVINKI